MNLTETINLNNTINKLLKEKLNTGLIFKLYKVQQSIQPEIESAISTLEKVREDNAENGNVETIVREAEKNLLQEESKIVLEPTISMSDLPKEMTGAMLIPLIPIIIEEENV